jgi:2-amino-4-hydroxy-6-hydroxymethyldihydropteridine diphosphokinase
MLSLGSNLGNRAENLSAARECLGQFFNVQRSSSVYETSPWGFTQQPDFLNQVLVGLTELPPFLLLERIKGIEKRLGREDTHRYGPRLIDLDILFYGDLVLKTPELVIPHPMIPERPFVLIPLAEIVPDYVHPIMGTTIEQMTYSMNPTGVWKYENSGE